VRIRLLTAGLVAAAALVAPSAAPATATSCRFEVLKAWAANSLGPNFPLQCYRAAMANLPADLAGYSTAREDIQQALLGAIRKAGGGERSAAGAQSAGGSTPSALAVTALVGGALLAGISLVAYAVVRRRH
jgi:hypothetical protein